MAPEEDTTLNENENLRARLTELALCVSTGQLHMEDIARKLCELAELPEDCEDLVSHIRNPEKTCDTCARYKLDLASAPKSWATCSEKHEVGKENCPDSPAFSRRAMLNIPMY